MRRYSNVNVKEQRANALRWSCLLSLLFFQFNGFSQNASVPGELVSPFPTIANLAVEWYMQGDENHNSVVAVTYREKGEQAWKEGMPLRRVPAGTIYGFSWLDKHAGSIFDLKPGTRYEINLRLTDPDGGSAEKSIEAVTRSIPVVGEQAEIVELEPGEHDTLFTKSGTEQRPVVYRCSKGKATFGFIDLQHKKWVYLDGLYVVNLKEEGVGIRMDGAEYCALMYCNINAVYGVVADLPGATNCYFGDNTLKGTCTWELPSMGADGLNVGEGFQITGSGNVICYNKVTGFRDCISTMEGTRASKQICVDIYNNDIYVGVDDGIEADFCYSNCRIFRNRMTDCAIGLSAQPSLGGPTYFVRNVMYNIIHSGFKLKNYSRGDVVLHNTLVKIGVGMGGNARMDYAYFRNNLVFGGPTHGIVMRGGYDVGRPYAADIIGPGKHSSFDYDAVGVSGTAYKAKIGKKEFSEVEKNGLSRLVFSEVFPGIGFPEKPLLMTDGTPDLRPDGHSKVIDAGQIIPGINDQFKGKAPDIGAYEAGEPLPHYGPRERNP